GGLAALAGAGCLLGRLGRLGAFVGLLRRAGLLARRGLRRRNVGPLCRGPRLFGGLWLLGRGTGLGVDGYCWNGVHRAFSLGGDYRDHMDHSGWPELQANSDGNPTWADRRRRRTTLKTSPQTVAHFAKPARIPRRERAEDPKTIRKTARRTVKTLNKGPNFRMVDTYATPFLFDWPSGAPAWHYPGGHPRLVRKPHDCSRNHPRRPPASARLGSGAPQTRWHAADSATLAHGERSTGTERDGRPPRSSRTPGRTVRRGCVGSRSGGHHQEHARKAQDRPRSRGNRRLVPRSPASAGGRESGR